MSFGDPKRLGQIIDCFSNAVVLVVGDMMLDRFIWGKVNRISPEAPVPVVQVTHESAHLGGSANVVSNIVALGGRAVPVGLLGRDEPGKILMQALEQRGVPLEGMIVDASFQTIQKTRIIAHHQQLVRVDREVEFPSEDRFGESVRERVADLAPRADALIVSDYGKGVISKQLLQDLNQNFNKLVVNVDPKDKNFNFYKRVHILTPNQAEAERMSGIAIADEAGLSAAAAKIFQSLQCSHLLITRGEQGMALFRTPTDMVLIPTLAQEVFDVSGAGDTVIATFTLAQAVGADLREAAILANAAAGVVVGKLGTASLDPEELKAAIRKGN